MPLLGNRPHRAAVVDRLDSKHGDLGDAAGLMEGTAARMIDQAFVGHVVEQALQVDLGLAGEAERARNFTLSGRLVGRSDEVEDLLAGGEVGVALAGHGVALNAASAAGYPCCRAG